MASIDANSAILGGVREQTKCETFCNGVKKTAAFLGKAISVGAVLASVAALAEIHFVSGVAEFATGAALLSPVGWAVLGGAGLLAIALFCLLRKKPTPAQMERDRLNDVLGANEAPFEPVSDL